MMTFKPTLSLADNALSQYRSLVVTHYQREQDVAQVKLICAKYDLPDFNFETFTQITDKKQQTLAKVPINLEPSAKPYESNYSSAAKQEQLTL